MWLWFTQNLICSYGNPIFKACLVLFHVKLYKVASLNIATLLKCKFSPQKKYLNFIPVPNFSQIVQGRSQISRHEIRYDVRISQIFADFGMDLSNSIGTPNLIIIGKQTSTLVKMGGQDACKILKQQILNRVLPSWGDWRNPPLSRLCLPPS